MSVVKMRCNRASTFDQGGTVMKEVSLVSTDKAGVALNPPEEVTYANFSGTFVGAAGATMVHDALVDVTFVASAPAADAPESEE